MMRKLMDIIAEGDESKEKRAKAYRAIERDSLSDDKETAEKADAAFDRWRDHSMSAEEMDRWAGREDEHKGINESFDDEFSIRIAKVFEPLKHRESINSVYDQVLEGMPFEDAISVIADRDGLNPLDLRELVVSDYKDLRSKGSTYDHVSGRELVHILNQTIRESVELMEKSQHVGTYTNKAGSVIKVLRADHDPKHHMFMNDKGEVSSSMHGEEGEVHEKLTQDGFNGSFHK